MDLGAQFIYQEAIGNAFEANWPFELMKREYYGCDKFIIYESSGRRLNGDLARKYDEIIREPEIKIPVFHNECNFLGSFFQRV